jgi:hypothetical protein
MRRVLAIAVCTATLLACGGSSSNSSPSTTTTRSTTTRDASEPTLPPTTHYDSAAPTTLDHPANTPPTVPASDQPPFIQKTKPESIGYLLDNGLVLWVKPPIGDIVAGDGVCAHLVGDTAAFYAKYNKDTIPGFEGLVCHAESVNSL